MSDYKYQTRADLLSAWREKYPAYRSWDDDRLYTGIVNKYPVYAQQVAENFSDSPPAVSSASSIPGEDTRAGMFSGGLPEGWVGPAPSGNVTALPGFNHYKELYDKRTERRGFWEGITDWSKKDAPFAGNVFEAKTIWDALSTYKKLEKGEAVADEDLLKFNTWLETSRRMEHATWKGKAGDILRGQVKFWTEIGVAALAWASIIPGDEAAVIGSKLSGETVKKAALDAAEQFFKETGLKKGSLTLMQKAAFNRKVNAATAEAVKKQAYKNVRGKLTSHLSKEWTTTKAGNLAIDLAAGGLVAGADAGIKGIALTAFNPGLVQSTTAQQAMRQYFLTGNEDMKRAVLMGVLDAVKENSTEMMGWTAGKIAGRILPNTVTKNVVYGALFRNMEPKLASPKLNSFIRFVQKAGADGILEEMYEERIAGFIGGMLGLEGDDRAGLRKAIETMIPDADQLKAEMLAFAIPGVAMGTAAYAGKSTLIGGVGYEQYEKNLANLNARYQRSDNPEERVRLDSELKAMSKELADQSKQEIINEGPVSRFIRGRLLRMTERAGSVDDLLIKTNRQTTRAIVDEAERHGMDPDAAVFNYLRSVVGARVYSVETEGRKAEVQEQIKSGVIEPVELRKNTLWEVKASEFTREHAEESAVAKGTFKDLARIRENGVFEGVEIDADTYRHTEGTPEFNKELSNHQRVFGFTSRVDARRHYMMLRSILENEKARPDDRIRFEVSPGFSVIDTVEEFKRRGYPVKADEKGVAKRYVMAFNRTGTVSLAPQGRIPDLVEDYLEASAERVLGGKSLSLDSRLEDTSNKINARLRLQLEEERGKKGSARNEHLIDTLESQVAWGETDGTRFEQLIKLYVTGRLGIWSMDREIWRKLSLEKSEIDALDEFFADAVGAGLLDQIKAVREIQGREAAASEKEQDSRRKEAEKAASETRTGAEAGQEPSGEEKASEGAPGAVEEVPPEEADKDLTTMSLAIEERLNDLVETPLAITGAGEPGFLKTNYPDIVIQEGEDGIRFLVDMRHGVNVRYTRTKDVNRIYTTALNILKDHIVRVQADPKKQFYRTIRTEIAKDERDADSRIYQNIRKGLRTWKSRDEKTGAFQVKSVFSTKQFPTHMPVEERTIQDKDGKYKTVLRPVLNAAGREQREVTVTKFKEGYVTGETGAPGKEKQGIVPYWKNITSVLTVPEEYTEGYGMEEIGIEGVDYEIVETEDGERLVRPFFPLTRPGAKNEEDKNYPVQNAAAPNLITTWVDADKTEGRLTDMVRNSDLDERELHDMGEPRKQRNVIAELNAFSGAFDMNETERKPPLNPDVKIRDQIGGFKVISNSALAGALQVRGKNPKIPLQSFTSLILSKGAFLRPNGPQATEAARAVRASDAVIILAGNEFMEQDQAYAVKIGERKKDKKPVFDRRKGGGFAMLGSRIAQHATFGNFPMFYPQTSYEDISAQTEAPVESTRLHRKPLLVIHEGMPADQIRDSIALFLTENGAKNTVLVNFDANGEPSAGWVQKIVTPSLIAAIDSIPSDIRPMDYVQVTNDYGKRALPTDEEAITAGTLANLSASARARLGIKAPSGSRSPNPKTQRYHPVEPRPDLPAMDDASFSITPDTMSKFGAIGYVDYYGKTHWENTVQEGDTPGSHASVFKILISPSMRFYLRYDDYGETTLTVKWDETPDEESMLSVEAQVKGFSSVVHTVWSSGNITAIRKNKVTKTGIAKKRSADISNLPNEFVVDVQDPFLDVVKLYRKNPLGFMMITYIEGSPAAGEEWKQISNAEAVGAYEISLGEGKREDAASYSLTWGNAVSSTSWTMGKEGWSKAQMGEFNRQWNPVVAGIAAEQDPDRAASLFRRANWPDTRAGNIVRDKVASLLRRRFPETPEERQAEAERAVEEAAPIIDQKEEQLRMFSLVDVEFLNAPGTGTLTGAAALQNLLRAELGAQKASQHTARLRWQQWERDAGVRQPIGDRPWRHTYKPEEIERGDRLFRAITAKMEGLDRIPVGPDRDLQLADASARYETKYEPGTVEEAFADYNTNRKEGMKSAEELYEEIRAATEQARQAMNAEVADLGQEEWIGFRKNYVLHKYRSYTKADKEAIEHMSARYRETTGREFHRKLPTYADAAQYGLTPLTMNAAELYAMWVEDVNRVKTNKLMLSLGSTLQEIDGAPIMVPVISTEYAGKAAIPEPYLQNSIEQLAAFLGVKKPQGTMAEQMKALTDQLMNTHGKDYQLLKSNYPSLSGLIVRRGPALNFVKMFQGQSLKNPTIQFLEHMNAWMKYMAVGLPFVSLFHAFAMGESDIAASGLKGSPVFKMLKNPVSYSKELQAEAQTYRDNPFISEEWIRDGLQIDQSNPDITGMGIVDQDLARWAAQLREDRSIPYGEKLADGIERFHEWKRWWDNWLWHEYHPFLKLHLAQTIFERRMAEAMESNSYVDPDMLRQDIANTVNGAVGGMEWERFQWATPIVRQILHLTTFAPDWTMASAWISGITNLPILREIIGNAPSQVAKDEMWRHYWPAMVTLVMVGIPSALQFGLWLFTRPVGDPDDQPFPFLNEKGKKTHVDITPVVRLFRGVPGVGYEGGETGKRRVYLRWGKQAYEVFDGWVPKPLDTLMGKTSQLFKLAFEQATGTTTNGWDLPFKDQGLMGALEVDGSFWKSRAGYVARKFTPYTVLNWIDGYPSAFFAPASRGISKFRAITDMQNVIYAFADDATFKKVADMGKETRLRDLVTEIWNAAEANGYDGEEIYARAVAHVRSNVYGRLFKAINEQNEKEMEKIAGQIVRLNGNLDTVNQSMSNRFKAANQVWSNERLSERVRTILE